MEITFRSKKFMRIDSIGIVRAWESIFRIGTRGGFRRGGTVAALRTVSRPWSLSRTGANGREVERSAEHRLIGGLLIFRQDRLDLFGSGGLRFFHGRAHRGEVGRRAAAGSARSAVTRSAGTAWSAAGTARSAGTVAWSAIARSARSAAGSTWSAVTRSTGTAGSTAPRSPAGSAVARSEAGTAGKSAAGRSDGHGLEHLPTHRLEHRRDFLGLRV